MKQFLVIAAIAVVFGGFVVLITWVERKRRSAIETLLKSRGDQVWIKPSADEQATAYAAVGHPPELKDGHTGVKWAAHLTSQNLPAWIVEHSYSRGSGKSRRTYNHTLISVPVPASWASTTVARESLWNKIERLWGSKDLQLDNEVFNKSFRVTTDDENFALVFLTPAVQEWLLATPAGWTVAIRAGYLQIYTGTAANAAWLPKLCAAPEELLGRTTPELFA